MHSYLFRREDGLCNRHTYIVRMCAQSGQSDTYYVHSQVRVNTYYNQNTRHCYGGRHYTTVEEADHTSYPYDALLHVITQ